MKINYDSARELLITARKGNDFEMSLSGVQIDGVDITSSYDATMIIKSSETGSAVYSWETPNEIIITTGQIAINCPAASFTVAAGNYVYELSITYPDDTVQTWLNGTFIINSF